MLEVTEEREQREGAQRRIKKALATDEGRAKVHADPKKLPTAKLGERWLCQWEQLALPCPLAPDHFERNAHKVCAWCFVIGHPLARCPLAAKDPPLAAALSALAAAPPPSDGGGKASSGKGGKGGSKGGGKGRAEPAAPALSRWEQMEQERAATFSSQGQRRK